MTVSRVKTLPVETTPPLTPDFALIRLAGDLLYAVKTEAATDRLEAALSGLEPARLLTGLPNDTARKAFWINLYNAYFQLFAIREKKQSPQLFTEKLVPIAGQLFSLDNIEHGILRRYRWKVSLGYLPQLWPARRIKRLAVSVLDYRIHFALNCGAKSCPPIAFYDYERLDAQLDLATDSFLQAETDIDAATATVSVSKIMTWYRGDFGGKAGILAIVGRVLNHDLAGYQLRFADYDWSAHLRNYTVH